MQETRSKHRASWPAMIAAAALAVAAAMPVATHAESDAVKALAAPPPIQLPLKPSPEFAKFPQYAGTLGKRQIVLRLGAKTDDPSGVHGEYQFADTGEVILIAGDRDGDTLEVEESNDGTHITGNWVGKFAADGSIEGERMNVDDSNPLEFSLRPLAAGQKAPSAAPVQAQKPAQQPTQQPAQQPTQQPAQPRTGGQPVNGVNNLTIGE
ncbi:hypothetical protein WQE_24922 [Paraburkholderia hospita]|uniref:Uncharacterized protein n=1 Tax=Paraburkholderia hospita TaxID=169430 RepID=A0ABN0FHC3_9BURK|nr:hypothetical protein [Paraburkholderia hospita]EIM98167.1 hypothetical protein WQE_24922 [Paraburkholderia hospita]OUL70830.1 hypothetical protein CA602_47690 [Paraburkholderia hospita]OUL97108.1 hypothetical protein CA601_00950 [Paraburkholderia hospita]